MTRKGAHVQENTNITALKVRVLFINELTDTKITGMVPCYLYGIFYVIASMWRCDVQDIEGMNNILQMVARKAPAISLPLLDARVANRKRLGLGRKADQGKLWSAIAPFAEGVVDIAVAYNDAADVMTREDIFSTPGAVTPVCNDNL